MTRDYISLKTKLASALLTIRVTDENGKLTPLIPFEDAKKMTADQIISLFDWDHYPVAKALGGPDAPWNLTPRPILEHRIKTATKDVPMIAKCARISEATEDFKRRMLAKTGPPRKVVRKLWVRPGFKFDWKQNRYVKEKQ